MLSGMLTIPNEMKFSLKQEIFHVEVENEKGIVFQFQINLKLKLKLFSFYLHFVLGIFAFQFNLFFRITGHAS